MKTPPTKAGGACYDLHEIKKIRQVCDEHKLGFHLDGARLFNALVAKKERPEQYGKLFHTISICLSKGLGAPVGTVLVGDEVYMKKALRIRKIFGGGMRQAGFLAAAGLYALDHHVERLVEDHERAKEIGSVLQEQGYIREVEPVETNIVIFYLKDQGKEAIFLEQLAQNNIKISTMGQGKLRIVTHLDYDAKMHKKVIGILKELK